MIFQLHIDCGNDAFGQTKASRNFQLANMLARLAERLRMTDGDDPGTVRDYNGNSCGSYEFLKG